MRIKLLLLFLILAGYTAAQDYPLVTLYDINYIHPDSLPGFPPSLMAGDTVRVRGLVLVPPVISPTGNRQPIIWAGAAWSNYVQDADNGIWGGMNIYQADTVGAAQGTLFDEVDTGKVYEFTGVVTPYYQSTELMLITSPVPVPVVPRGPHPNVRPQPIQLSMDSLWTQSGGNYMMRKYQGMYVEFRADAQNNLITSDRVTGTGSSSGNYKVNDGTGKYFMVYAQSRYFKSNANGIIPGYQPPSDGSFLPYVRGILTMRKNTNTNTVDYWIVPIYPGDVGEVTVAPPSVSGIRRDRALVQSGETVNITAKALGNFGAHVTSVKLFYRVNGGNTDSLTMVKSAGDTTLYTVNIPGSTDSSLVDYYVKATDNNGLSVTNPANLSNNRFFYLVLNRPLTIRDVRYSPFGSGYSGYNNYRVTISGVVIADTSDIPGNRTNPSRVYMQDGEASWSGILLGTSGPNGTTFVDNLKRGDRITVEGVITLGSRGTRIDSIGTLTVHSSNNPLPEAKLLTTGEVGVSVLGTLSAEQWSSMLVKYQNVTIDSLNADGNSNFGESYANDGTLPHTRIIWSDGRTSYDNGYNSGDPSYTQLSKGDKFSEVKGVLSFTHSYYKLTPRNNNDVTGYNPVGVNDLVEIPSAFALEQNYPNPFNPTTNIRYSIPSEGFVTLRIYDMLGQEVATLVNHVQSAGVYTANFNAGSMTSGIYFYSLKVGDNVLVKKMMLIK
jgi:hypothetical protein